MQLYPLFQDLSLFPSSGVTLNNDIGDSCMYTCSMLSGFSFLFQASSIWGMMDRVIQAVLPVHVVQPWALFFVTLSDFFWWPSLIEACWWVGTLADDEG